MIPEIYIIRDEEGTEVATIKRKGGKLSIELDEKYTIENNEK